MVKAFVTWNVPEYKEWAVKKSYGYLLTIIRNRQLILAIGPGRQWKYF